MAFFETALGGAVLDVGKNLIGSFFGKRSAEKAAARARIEKMREFSDLRQAAIKGGFNPLTALGAGYPGGSYSGPPPLTSTAALMGSLDSVSDLLTGRTAQEIAETRKRAELLDLELSTLKAGSSFMQDPGAYRYRSNTSGASGTIGGGGGFNTVGGAMPADRIDTLNRVDPTREQMDMPVSSGPGLTVIDNAGLDIPIIVPGADGEPWGFDEVITAGVFGAPQILEHKLKTDPWGVADRVQDFLMPVRQYFPKIGMTPKGDYVDPNTPFQMWSN